MTKQLLKKLANQQFAGVLTLLMLLCSTTVTVAQLHNNGVLRVNANATLYVKSGDVTFGSSSATSTNQTAPYAATDGKIMLGSGVAFDTDGTLTKFVNGYAGTYSTSETTLALGAGTGLDAIYAPIKVTAAPNTNGVHATYFNSEPPSIANKDALVTAIADTEYWIVKGEDAMVSLSWRSTSNLNTFTASLVGVTIVGYNTIDDEWQIIDSAPEPGATLSAGFIKSTSAIDLDAYSAFAIGEKGPSCFPTYSSSGSTKTWNGSSWTGGTPTLNDPAELSGAYNGLGFQCYTLALGSNNVTLTGGTLEVVGNITGTGKVILDENDGLVQHISTATKPQIELTRTTRTGMHKFDYVYWGAPVTENVLTQLNANAIAVGGSTPNAFDLKYKYVSGDLTTAGGWKFLDATVPGKGFIMRIADQAPFTGAGTGSINLKFTGTANNGDIEVAVAKVAGNDTSARNNNLLANPYPSAIDAEKFLTENNSLVDGVIYLWRANTVNATGTTQYTNADYIAYTKAGAQTYSGVGSAEVFNGNIASGQGFKVRALTSGDAKFTNCMRVVNNNSQFLRTNAFATTTETVVDRFRVSLSTDNGIANQTLVAYLPATTLAYDYMYDARMLTTSGTTLFSILDNDTQRLAINARPDFVNTDEVTLGFTKDAAVTTPMSITIADREGVFANNQTPIYLHDTVLNTYHDFANGAYTFNTTATQDVSRFKIVYQASQLGNEDFTEGMVHAYIKDNTFNLSSSKEVETVQIFDLTGRLVATYTANQQKTLREDFNFAIAVYVAKIKFTDGSVSSQKLINQQ